ncbi:Fic family protein [Tumebacillus permanentifrigoris]|uniref:Fic family protein n=2 Tax=Tumebacillus permanentifrigoris TaxID=378543 RepID=A0A316DF40_9BACL|nr:Fic family protein [Tumebacillus permanentifrigoris]
MSFRDDKIEKISYNLPVVNLLNRINEYKGKQELYKHQSPELLDALLQVAKIQSVESSNRIEGIFAEDKRISLLVKEKVEPRNRDEAEIAGYRDCLELIHASATHMPIKPHIIQQVHRTMMALSTGTGGNWKSVDNFIRETLPSGEQVVRFIPVPAWKTQDAMEELCQLYLEKKDKGQVPSLVLDALFVLDFLSVHPFSDGNGRMARLLTLWVLYLGGFEVGRYISLEKLVEQLKEQYYKTLQQSSQGWHDGEHDVAPWLEYYLTIVLRAYQKFDEHVGTISTRSRGWKKKKIESVVDSFIADFTIADLLDRCPGIARPTVTRTLSQLSQQGVIECVELGRNARWRKLK